MTKTATTTTLLLGLTLLGSAFAQGNSPVKLTNTMQRVTTVTENGKTVEKFSEVKGGVMPNEVLQFTYTYQNISKNTVNDNNLDTAVPAPTAFMSQKCDVAAKAVFSIDKQVLDKSNLVTNVKTMKFAAAPLKKTVTVKENGVDVKKEVVVDPSEYTAVRWMLPSIKAGQAYTCVMRVKVK